MLKNEMTEQQKNKKIIDDWMREGQERGPLSSDDLFRMNAEQQRKLRNPTPQPVKNNPYPAKSPVQAPRDVNRMTQAQRDKIIDDWMKADLSEMNAPRQQELYRPQPVKNNFYPTKLPVQAPRDVNQMTQAQRDKIIDDWMKADLSEISAPRQQEFHSLQPLTQMNKNADAGDPQVLMNELQKSMGTKNLNAGVKQLFNNTEIQLEQPRANYKIPENPYVINSQDLPDLVGDLPWQPWKKQSDSNFVDPLLRPYLQNKPANDSIETEQPDPWKSSAGYFRLLESGMTPEEIDQYRQDDLKFRQDKMVERQYRNANPQRPKKNWQPGESSWEDATDREEVYAEMFPDIDDPVQKFQFMDVRVPENEGSGFTAEELNDYLEGTYFEGQGETFLEAEKQYGINAAFLAVSAILEGGSKGSDLARGIVKGFEGYRNVYGIGANDGNVSLGGAATAARHEWNSLEKAIIGGAEVMKEQYVDAGQVNSYQFRWNPYNLKDVAVHQYATAIHWASERAKELKKIYDQYQPGAENAREFDYYWGG